MKDKFTKVKGFTLNGKPVYECWCGALIGAWNVAEAKREHKFHNTEEEDESDE